MHSAILSTFIKLPVFIKTLILSFYVWPFYTVWCLCSISIQTNATLSVWQFSSVTTCQPINPACSYQPDCCSCLVVDCLLAFTYCLLLYRSISHSTCLLCCLQDLPCVSRILGLLLAGLSVTISLYLLVMLSARLTLCISHTWLTACWFICQYLTLPAWYAVCLTY